MTDPTFSPAPGPTHLATPSGLIARRQRLVIGGAVVAVAAVAALILILMSGGSTPSPSGFTRANPAAAPKVARANTLALAQMRAWSTAVQNCGSNIVCVEKVDRTLGDQLHLYANYVGSLQQSGAAGKIVANALNTAQVTANTFEILGDAQPTHANYNQVLHHFNLQGQIDKMTAAINNLAATVNH